MFRRNGLILFLMVLLTPVFFSTADSYGEKWPSEPFTIVVPSSPGGGLDRFSRTLQPYLQEELGVPVVVENRPGGALVVGTEGHLKNDPADGSYVVHSLTPYLSGGIIRGADYDFNDFSYICVYSALTQGIFVRKDSSVTTLAGLVERMREKDMSYAYIPGSYMMLGPKLLEEATGVTAVGIPYNGGAPARADFAGGHVDFINSIMINTIVELGEKKVRPLAYWGEERNSLYPDVPTVNEELKKMGIIKTLPPLSGYYFVAVNKKFKEKYPDRFDVLVNAYKGAMKNTKLKEKFEKQRWPIVFMGPEKATAALQKDHEVVMRFKQYWKKK